MPAGALGFEAPYPIEPGNAPAWMVLKLTDGALDKASGRVVPAAALDHPEHWRE
ncbi:MAG: hypothetical protein ABI333_18670 [bacterium]